MQNTTKTDKTEKNVRATECSVYIPVAYDGIASPASENLEKSTSAQGSGKAAATSVLERVCSFHSLFTICDLAIGDLAIGNLAIECLGVHAIESLDDVRVATNFVKMMRRKRFARNKVSNLDSTIPILLVVPRRMVFASFSRSWE